MTEEYKLPIFFKYNEEKFKATANVDGSKRELPKTSPS